MNMFKIKSTPVPWVVPWVIEPLPMHVDGSHIECVAIAFGEQHCQKAGTRAQIKDAAQVVPCNMR